MATKLFLILFLAGWCEAQERLFSEARITPVSGDRGFNDDPSLARASDGSVYVSWLSFRDGFDTLQVARYQPEGEQLKRLGSWQVAGGRDVYVHGAKLVAAGDGVYLVYAAERGSGWDVFAAHCGPKGPGRPLPITSNAQVNIKPSAAWHDDALVVAWESNRGGSRHIWTSSLREGKVSPAEAVTAGPDSNYAPSLAITMNGTLFIAWHSFRSHNYDIYLRQRRPGGGWESERRLTRAPALDRHVRLVGRANELWAAYENAAASGYRIGTTNQRRVIVARVAPSGLEAPLEFEKSPLFEARAESPAAVFDEQGRLWVAHLRPRLPRGGWEVHFTGFNGQKWEPAARVSLRKGMDREPGLVLDGQTAIVAFQADEFPESWANGDPAMTERARSEILLASIDLRRAGATLPAALEPLREPEDAFEAAGLHAAYGEDAQTPEIDYQGQKLKLYYGDLHSHSDVSVCNRCGDQSIDEDFQHHRDLSRLDFAAVTDHGYNIVPYLWSYSAKLARMNTDPGRLLGFLGQEWTSSIEKYSSKHPFGYYGHRNLIFADPFFPKWWNAMGGQTPGELWNELRRMKADFVNIPHQLADTGNVPTDWDYADETSQPVAEIFQVRGSYEHLGAPRQAQRATPSKGYFLQDAWQRGVVIGVIASPDHGGGLGKACVWAPDLSRAAILEAIRARRTFGTTAARMMLDVRVNGRMMGEKIPSPKGKPVEIQVNLRAPGTVARVEICRNNRFVYSQEPGESNVSFTFRDSTPVDTPSYYYVRVQQADQEIAWSSPVWLGAE